MECRGAEKEELDTLALQISSSPKNLSSSQMKKFLTKNRKAEPASVRFGPAIKAFLLCVLIGSTGVGYVWQRGQIDQLGKDITQREKRLADLQRDNRIRADRLAALLSPPQLEARVKMFNLNMAPAMESQKVRLVETPVNTAPNTLGEGTERMLVQASR